MKNSIISISVAALLSGSIPVFASSVSGLNNFTAGTPAVAAQVNANFDALAVGVNDNDSRITTNTSAIATNAANISTNTASISTNTANIATNTSAIAALQSGTSCPSDMVAVGSLCVDLYEASIWNAATGGSQIAPNGSAPWWPCAANGSDCGDGAANPIYARSVAGVTPAIRATHYQAAQACANVGKRLPSTNEWQMAASGTPADGTTCNSPAAAGALGNTGALASCVSTAGAFDMVGNLWEWTADLDYSTGALATIKSTNTLVATVIGESYLNLSGGAPSDKLFFHPSSGPAATPQDVGFRCVK